MPSYQGNIEKVSSRTVVGWVCDLKSPDRHLDVTVSVNGEEIGTVFANRFCPSLAERSLRGRHHGFQLVIPERIQLVYHVEAIADSGSYNIPPATPNLISKETNRPLPEAWKRKTGTYRFPSVFILGAAKCGTTSLHSYLMQHPDIAMSNPKEPYFFEAEYNYGPTYYLNRYFNYWRGESVVGEARHRNLYLPYVPERILSYNPDAKLIVILRNPSERAISHWWHWYAREINPVMNTVSHVWHRRPRKASLVRKAVSRWRHRHCQQLETLPLREALLADWKRISSGPSFANTADIDRYAKSLEPDGKGLYRTYLDSGYYYEQLIRYIQLFGRDRLHIILFENLVSDPRGAVTQAFEFLGVDPACARWLEYETLNASVGGAEQYVDEDTANWLIDHYRDHNEKLESLLHLDLSAWNQLSQTQKVKPKKTTPPLDAGIPESPVPQAATLTPGL